MLFTLFCLAALTGCGNSSNSDFVLTNTSTVSQLTIRPDVSAAVAPRISSSVTTFRVSVYNSAGTLLALATQSRGLDVELTGISNGFILIRTEGLDTGGNLVGYFDISIEFSGDTVVDVPALITATTVPTSISPVQAQGSISAIVFTELPDEITGEVDFDLAVTAFDADGSLFTGATGDVEIATSGVSTDTYGPVTFTNGVAQFENLQFRLLTEGSVTFTATSGNFSGQTPSISVVEVELLDPAVDLTERFLTVFVNVFEATPGEEDDSYFPTYDHKWDLNSGPGEYFSIADGNGDSFDRGFQIAIGLSGGSLDGFDSAGNEGEYGDLTWMTPLFGAEDGLVAAAVVPTTSLFGSTTSNQAFLAPGKENRLHQTLDLTSATGTITLNWDDAYDIPDDDDFAVPNEQYRVVVRDTSGALLSTLRSVTNEASTRTTRNADLTSFAGRQVVLSFELLNSQVSDSADFDENFVDDVSVIDGNATEFVTNGDFETGDLTGWEQFVEPVSQHIRSEVRTVSGVEVVRYFYSPPNVKWGRYLDAYTNNTAADITLDIEVEFDPGGVNQYYVPASNPNGVIALQQNSDKDDIGTVLGDTVFDNDPLTNPAEIDGEYTITIPAGESRSLCYFGMQDNERAADGVEPAILTELVRIGEEFRTDPELLRGLTQEQLDSIVNL